MRKVPGECRCHPGRSVNGEARLRSLGKAGAKRWRGCSSDRFVCCHEPVESPAGGGEGAVNSVVATQYPPMGLPRPRVPRLVQQAHRQDDCPSPQQVGDTTCRVLIKKVFYRSSPVKRRSKWQLRRTNRQAKSRLGRAVLWSCRKDGC